MALDLPRTTSGSQLTTYAICGRKYVLQYGYGVEPEFRSTSLVLGSAIHSAIEWWFEERSNGKAPSLEAAREILAADLMAGSTGGPIRWKDATPESLEADACRYLDTYLSRFADLPVVRVEDPFMVDLVDSETGECVGRPLKGYFDLVLQDESVVEVKTSSRAWAEFDLVRHLQVGGYAFAFNALHGGPSAVQVHVILKLKREPRVDVYQIRRAEFATRWWLRAASAIERAVDAQQFAPGPSALCRECQYEHACAAWIGEEPECNAPLPAPATAAQVGSWVGLEP